MDNPVGDVGNVDDLRPRGFSEFIGQQSVTDRLSLLIEAAKIERQPLGHVFINAPPGCGKTSLAQIIATEVDDPIWIHNMPMDVKAIERVVRKINRGDDDRGAGGILFLDEIHAASKKEQEILLPLLEFGELHLPNGKIVHCDWLTVIGCTTDPIDVIATLQERFHHKPYFETYNDDEMALIAKGMADKCNLTFSDEDLQALGRAGGAVPRRVRNFIVAGRKIASVHKREVTAEEILEFCQVEPDGLEREHIDYLNALNDLDGTAGLERLCAVTRQHPGVIKQLENLLFARGLITFGDRGRVLEDKGYHRIRPPARGGRRPSTTDDEEPVTIGA